MKTRVLTLLLLMPLAGVLACAKPGAPTLAQLPDVDTKAVLDHVKVLSSDEFEGRQPGSKGEKLPTDYLIAELKNEGLEPGNPNGSWTQKVSLVGLTPKPQGGFVVKKGATTKEFNINKDVVVMSKHVTEDVKLENSELVFAGYGVQAPEYQWDDFKGMDVKGKTLIVLVNDRPGRTRPIRRTGSEDLRRNAMIYSGRRPSRNAPVRLRGGHRDVPRDRARRLSVERRAELRRRAAGSRDAGQEHGPRGDSRLDLARRRDEALQARGPRLSEAQGRSGHARLQARAAQAERVDVVQADAAPDQSQNVVAKITGADDIEE
jgi:hypothetical protein